MNVNARRDFLKLAGAALLGPAVAASLRADEKNGSPKKILFFTKSSGFEHSVVKRDGDKLAHAERILTEAARPHGFEIVASKDGRLFEPDQIGQFDAFAFYTTGDLLQPGNDKTPPMSKAGEEAFYEAIRSGKGLIGMHCATDTFGHHRGRGADDPYIKLIGGEFITHGAQHVARLVVEDQEFPGARPFGPSFEINDEWYAQKHLGDDLRVIIAHDTSTMKGKMYERPNFPQTWLRKEGRGRVFYTSMGHREDVWENPKYQGLLIGALMVVTGQTEADLTPNIQSVTPGYKQVGA
jgi:type 1 glutamine amidotransferase